MLTSPWVRKRKILCLMVIRLCFDPQKEKEHSYKWWIPGLTTRNFKWKTNTSIQFYTFFSQGYGDFKLVILQKFGPGKKKKDWKEGEEKRQASTSRQDQCPPFIFPENSDWHLPHFSTLDKQPVSWNHHRSFLASDGARAGRMVPRHSRRNSVRAFLW